MQPYSYFTLTPQKFVGVIAAKNSTVYKFVNQHNSDECIAVICKGCT